MCERDGSRRATGVVQSHSQTATNGRKQGNAKKRESSPDPSIIRRMDHQHLKGHGNVSSVISAVLLTRAIFQ